MPELLYHTDSYLREFEAKCLEARPEDRAVVLDRTAFYPGGGGQPCDQGLLSDGQTEWSVHAVRKGPSGIDHFLEGDGELPRVGARLQGRLDWERRYRLMRTHTAMHILCGVIFRDYGALVTGGDMNLEQARMDFEFEAMTAELAARIEEAANLEVAKDLPIRVQVLPRDEAFQIPDLIRTKINLLPPGILEIRTVEIVGLDLQADGGTHVHSTREVGGIRVVDYLSKGRINKRLYVALLDSAGQQ